RARYYDSQTGRWTSEDPLGFAAGDGNLYRYVGNDPTVRTDPTGMFDNDKVWEILYRKNRTAAAWFQKEAGGDFWNVNRSWYQSKVESEWVQQENGSRFPWVGINTKLSETEAAQALL